MVRLPRLAVGLLALLAAACGQQKPGAELRVADQKESLRTLIEVSGVMKGAPYEITWSSLADSIQVGEALAADAADTGAMAEATFLIAAANGAKIHAVQGIDTSSRGGGIAIVVPKDSPIRSVAQLRGVRIATTRNSTGHDLIVRLAEREGWPRDSIKPVFLAAPDAKAAFTSGSIDAWAVWDPFVATAQIEDGARIVVTANGLLPGLDAFQVASDKAIAGKRAILADFLARLAKAERWGAAHPKEYAAAWGQRFGLSPQVAALTVQRIGRTPALLDDDAARRTRLTVEQHHRNGLLSKAVDPAAFFDSSFNDAVTAK